MYILIMSAFYTPKMSAAYTPMVLEMSQVAAYRRDAASLSTQIRCGALVSGGRASGVGLESLEYLVAQSAWENGARSCMDTVCICRASGRHGLRASGTTGISSKV